MCHLVTIGIASGPDNPADIFRARGLHAAPAVNPHVRAAMPTGSVLLDVTDHGCSCSIYAREAGHIAFDVEAERTRYARKGWSRAKIARALESKQTAHGRRKVHSKADQFCQCVEALVRAGSHIVLISHNYSGLFTEEAVSIGARSPISLQAFLETLGTFPEDTLVTIE
jgi:hypothetical protein